jgi:hypothetical protein
MLNVIRLNLMGCLHDLSFSFNRERTHSGSVERIEDSIIFVYINPE